jgi:probable rRNA maturation factor
MVCDVATNTVSTRQAGAAVGEPTRPHLGGRQKVGGEGEPEVFVADEQRSVAMDLARWRSLAEAVLGDEGVRGNVELSILFVEPDDIAALNEQFLGESRPTDVLAFPIDAVDVDVMSSPTSGRSGPDRPPPDPGDQPLLLGDVVVCPSVAQSQAAEHAGALDDELALLVVHGILHVLGYDHDQPDETAVMRARELALLEAHHWDGPAPAGFRQEQS